MANVVINGKIYEDVPAIEIPRASGNGNAKFYDPDELLYAASPQSGGSATFANGIHYAQVDSTSTSTKFTATIPGITEYYDGLTIILKNGVVTSAANFTININGLGEKGSYSNLSAATRDTTLFNINYTMMFIYDSTRVSGGCWVCYRGYDANTNTIGYQVRGNSSTLLASQKFYRYRLLFTSADGTHFVPANTSSSTNATDARSVNQTKIDPFGRIVYYGATSAVNAEASPSASSLWELYTLALGYSFNISGGTLNLAFPAPVYIKCSPQSDGSAIIDDTTPIAQSLPSIDDNKIYIFLGIAYSATNIELFASHPVYYYKDGAIRIWTNAASSGSNVESDPIFSASPAAAITNEDISNWDNKSEFSGSYNDLEDKPSIPENTSDLTNDSGFITGMTILSYGISNWQNFIEAYNAKKVVYCRASSNSNPASGSQTRLAFMAYVDNADNPTNVEFQYYRSVNQHTQTQQGDQVYVYKLDKTAGWTVTVRENYTRIVAGTGLTATFNNGVLTISLDS